MPQIKQMTWTEVQKSYHGVAETIGWEADNNLGGLYEIGRLPLADGSSGWSLSIGYEFISEHASPQEAMAAGQNHLESQIRALLEPEHAASDRSGQALADASPF